jgi:hypothetical protein
LKSSKVSLNLVKEWQYNPYNSSWANLIAFTRLHTKTFQPCTILMNLWTHSSDGNKHGNPKINSTSHRTLKFLLAISFFGLSACIFTMKGRYSKYIIFKGESIEI